MDRKREVMAALYKPVYVGLVNGQEKAWGSIAARPSKMAKWLDEYCVAQNVDQVKRALLQYRLKAFLFEWNQALLATEQVWALHYNGTPIGIYDLFHFALDEHDLSNKELVLQASTVKTCLLQTAIFFEFFMLFVVDLMDISFKGYVNLVKVRTSLLNELQEGLRDESWERKANLLLEDLRGQKAEKGTGHYVVFDNWIRMVKVIRDGLVHRDKIKPFLDGKSVADRLEVNWEGIGKEVSAARFCEDVGGAVATLIEKVYPYLLDTVWMPGFVD